MLTKFFSNFQTYVLFARNKIDIDTKIIKKQIEKDREQLGLNHTRKYGGESNLNQVIKSILLLDVNITLTLFCYKIGRFTIAAVIPALPRSRSFALRAERRRERERKF